MATAENVFAWTVVAASNDTADSSINWTEGQDPNTVNNSARSMMAATKKWANTIGGNLIVSGSDAIFITTGQVISSGHQALGFRLCFKAAGTNTGPVTVAVDGLSAVAIKRPNGDALSAGDIVSGGFYDIAFDGTNYKLLAATGAAGTYGVLAGDNNWFGQNNFLGTTTIGNDVADVVIIKGTGVNSYMSGLMGTASVGALRAAMGLGTASLEYIGASGAAVPLLNGVNFWSGAQNILAAQSGNGVLYLQATNAASGQPVLSFAEPTGPRTTGSVTYAGAPGAFGVTYNVSSDGRLKQNRRPLNDSGAIIDALNPIYFRRGGAGNEDSGFIAQEIAAIPQMEHIVIRGDNDPNKRPGQPGFVDWQMAIGKMEAVLVAEIKALRARVAALEAAP